MRARADPHVPVHELIGDPGAVMSEQKRQNAEVDVDLMVAEVESGARSAARVRGEIHSRAGIRLVVVPALHRVQHPLHSDRDVRRQRGLQQSGSPRDSIWAFALALAMLAYPLFKTSPRSRVPVYDWPWQSSARPPVFICSISRTTSQIERPADDRRSGLFHTWHVEPGHCGLPCAWPAAVIVASVFVFYVFFGHLSVHAGCDPVERGLLRKAMWHFWMQTEGSSASALGVSASMIFLFVLFGSLLEKAGAGNYFIKLAFALLGHLRGGPAKRRWSPRRSPDFIPDPRSPTW